MQPVSCQPGARLGLRRARQALGDWRGKRRVYNCTACHYQHRRPASRARRSRSGGAHGLERPAHWVAKDREREQPLPSTHERTPWAQTHGTGRKTAMSDHAEARRRRAGVSQGLRLRRAGGCAQQRSAPGVAAPVRRLRRFLPGHYQRMTPSEIAEALARIERKAQAALRRRHPLQEHAAARGRGLRLRHQHLQVPRLPRLRACLRARRTT